MRVGVLGLGAMGSRMARRLHAEGHEVTGWNRDPTKTVGVAGDDMGKASTARLAAEGADAVITMVADDDALREITTGADGACAGLAPGACLVQMATVSHQALTRLSGDLPPGVEILDAPVLGSVAEAETGNLQIFVGGAESALERVAPILLALGSLMHVGELGAGTSAKLVANSTLLGCLAVLGESVALARGLGLSTERAFEVLDVTPLAAQAERRRPSITSGDFPPRFPLHLARKDSQLVVAAVHDHSLRARLIPAVRDWMLEAEEQGRGDADYTSLLAHIAEERT